MKKILLPLMFFTVLSLALAPCFVFAQSGPLDRLEAVQETADLPGGGEGSLERTIGAIINIVFSVTGIIIIAFMVYAGFLWMTAGGDSGKVDNAKTIIKNTIIGLIITVLSYGIAQFVLSAVLEATAI